MGRCYRLSKKPTKEQAEEALREIRESTGADRAEFMEEGTVLYISAKEERYPEIMGKTVNICRRVAGGAELSFLFRHVDGMENP